MLGMRAFHAPARIGAARSLASPRRLARERNPSELTPVGTHPYSNWPTTREAVPIDDVRPRCYSVAILNNPRKEVPCSEDALNVIEQLLDAGLICGDELTDVDRQFLNSLTAEEVEALVSIRSKTKLLPSGHIIPLKLI